VAVAPTAVTAMVEVERAAERVLVAKAAAVKTVQWC
jgi:hypothetical protein